MTRQMWCHGHLKGGGMVSLQQVIPTALKVFRMFLDLESSEII